MELFLIWIFDYEKSRSISFEFAKNLIQSKAFIHMAYTATDLKYVLKKFVLNGNDENILFLKIKNQSFIYVRL